MVPSPAVSPAPAPLLAAPASVRSDGWALTSEEGVRILYAAGKPVKVEATAPWSDEQIKTIVEAAIGAEVVEWSPIDWIDVREIGGQRAPITLMEDAASAFGWKATHELTLTGEGGAPVVSWRVMLDASGDALTAAESFHEEAATWSFDGTSWARGTLRDFPGVFKVEALGSVVP